MPISLAIRPTPILHPLRPTPNALRPPIDMTTTHPTRVTHSYIQHIMASPEVVFPLLCPELEREWVPGWDPTWILSTSGVAEEDCVFATDDEHGQSVWIITDHRPSTYVRMYKLTPGLVLTRLDITLRPRGANATSADVNYCYTALSSEGTAWVAERTADWYVRFMEEWEKELNAYLATR